MRKLTPERIEEMRRNGMHDGWGELCNASNPPRGAQVMTMTIERELLASFLDDGDWHTEAENVRKGIDLASYENELQLIDWLRRHTHPAAPTGVPDDRKLIGYVWPNEADYDHIHRCLGAGGDPEIQRIPAGAVGVYAMLAAAPSPGEPS
jgi:hypothetical protein